MTPLLFAIAVTVLSPSATLPPGAHWPDPSTLPLVQRNALTAAACGKLGEKTVAPDGVPFFKLNELPPGIAEHAVWRTVGGCPVREIVYRGQTYYVGPSAPKMETGPDIGNRIRRTDPAR